MASPDSNNTLSPEPAGQRAEPIDRLRDDVRLLGELVGEVLREQGGEDLFAAVEHLRTQAIEIRSGEQANEQQETGLFDWVSAQPTESLQQIVRAFSVYFHLINLAEQHHRSRTLLEREQTERPLRESVAAGVRELREAGASPQAIAEGLRRIRVHPVFTAHPSESRRRTLLQHLEQAASLIAQLDGLPEGPTRDNLLDLLRIRITLIWQTAETRLERPTVLDEVRSVLYFMAGNVYRVAPTVQRAVERALEDARRNGAAPSGPIPPVLRFGSWVGGDRDGNPAVTPEITRAAARMSHASVLQRYREELALLGRTLSISERLVGCSVELLASIERDLADLASQPVRGWADEPYRRKLGLMSERIRRRQSGETGGYAAPEGLLRDLELVRASLELHNGHRIASGPVDDLAWRVQTFGFHLAELEIRQHAARHTEAVAEMLGLTGVPGYESLGYKERLEVLEQRLSGPALSLPPGALSMPTREVLDTFAAMSDIQQSGGERACRTCVVSMTRAASDVLSVLFLAREAGLYSWEGAGSPARVGLDVVPLFEQIHELEECGAIMRSLYASPAYRAALEGRGNRQQIMVGYSDSNKDGGYLAASWQTYNAQRLLAETAREAGAELMVFHGRGGAVGRGGGPTGRAVMARPPQARLPGLKMTEQGEVIFARYGELQVSERHFEQALHALLVSSVSGGKDPVAHEPPQEWLDTMRSMAGASKAHYERLVKASPECLNFFNQATPFRELGTLNIASRPVSRAGGGMESIELEDLRAIPWVFSWTQTRLNLPGWFGLGTALAGEIDNGGLSRIQAMYRDWGFFSSTLDNAQYSLGTADMQTGRRYAMLADHGADTFGKIEQEYERTVRAVLQITGQSELLERSPILARSIKLRNPYVDALHLAQIALLRRYRSLPGDAPEEVREDLLDAVHHSINGVAAGLQTTG